MKLFSKVSTVVAAALFSVSTLGVAQEWPNKPIRMVAPQSAGGGPERTIRAVAKGLSDRLGQSVVVDYKPGANGNIGAADVANSAPDGYTWMLSAEHVATLNPSLYKSLGYDKQKLVATYLLGSLNQILACHPKTGINSIADLVRLANANKAKPLTYASPGAGSNGHLTMEMLLEELKIDMTHIPYRGPAPAVQDLIGGQVDCAFSVTSSLLENVKSKRVVGIATTSLARLSGLPEVPTLRDVGLTNVDGNLWLAMYAPRGVPKVVLDKFNKALEETVRGAEVTEAFAASSTIFAGPGLDAAQAEMAKSEAKWSRIIKKLNVTLD
jgi:tripartite-type tricarboxylate transporter receptor subunit TctC